MTAPDHRPYLKDGDLRSPLDVASWLKERWLKSSANRDYSYWQEHQVLEELYDVLDERLTRERRGAYRRAALDRFKSFACRARALRSGCVWDYDWPDETSELAWDAAEDCLAFRAAARQP